MKQINYFRRFSISLSVLWLFLFALLPFSLVIATSFLNHDANHLIQLPFTINHYLALNNYTYLHIFGKSFIMASTCTCCCLLFGYPFAYLIGRMQHKMKTILIFLVIIPFWTSSLIRSYALIAIIKTKGLLNTFLLYLGIIHQPISILFTNTAVLIGLVYNLLPFMILPILTSVERLDHRLIDAANDLGAKRFVIFRRIIIPLTMPGIIAGSTLVFLPAMTIFYIPDILGGAKSMLVGNLIQNQFLVAQNWPMGSAISVILTALLISLVLIYWRITQQNNKKQEWL